MHDMWPSEVAVVGGRIRERREQIGLSRRALGERAAVSERFLADVEAGTANPSLRVLGGLADALGTSPAALLAGVAGERARRGAEQLLADLSADEAAAAEALLRAHFRPRRAGVIALLGLRGAGKSTVGRALAAQLGIPFVELDALVERAAGLSAGEIFALHGEDYFRRIERETLARWLATTEAAVLATGGGLVADPATFDLLKRNATTVWLRATADEHWTRVVRQGDTRPMADNPAARAELERLLAAREPRYREADLTAETSSRTPTQVVDGIAAALDARAPR